MSADEAECHLLSRSEAAFHYTEESTEGIYGGISVESGWVICTDRSEILSRSKFGIILKETLNETT